MGWIRINQQGRSRASLGQCRVIKTSQKGLCVVRTGEGKAAELDRNTYTARDIYPSIFNDYSAGVFGVPIFALLGPVPLGGYYVICQLSDKAIILKKGDGIGKRSATNNQAFTTKRAGQVERVVLNS